MVLHRSDKDVRRPPERRSGRRPARLLRRFHKVDRDSSSLPLLSWVVFLFATLLVKMTSRRNSSNTGMEFGSDRKSDRERDCPPAAEGAGPPVSGFFLSKGRVGLFSVSIPGCCRELLLHQSSSCPNPLNFQPIIQ